MALATLLSLSIVSAIILLWALYTIAYIRSPLKRVPGPFLAKFTDLWRLAIHYRRIHIETLRQLHKKHGTAVRIGPNAVSISDPDLLKTIYSIRGTFLKSDFYSVNDALQDGHTIQNLFSMRSNPRHSREIKPVKKLFTQSHVVAMEPQIDDIIGELCDELEKRFINDANQGKPCDIAHWIVYFAWDLLGQVTFSRRFGFLKEARDVEGMIAMSEDTTRYFSVGQIPSLDKWLGKNPYCPIKFADFSKTVAFCVQNFVKRLQKIDEFKDKKDYLNEYLQLKTTHPDVVKDDEVIGYMMLNILAGADTTSIILRAFFYHVLKNPRVHERLVEELHTHISPATQDTKNSWTRLSHAELSRLPYLQACLSETFRIHPTSGHIFERVVPHSGLHISTNGSNVTLPPGTIVGINGWVLHFNEDVFGIPGYTTEDFVPERWLQGDFEDASQHAERTKRMRETDLSFGGGNRACLGKPLALVEILKVVAALFGKYKIELENPEKEWRLNTAWFVTPHDINVKLSMH